MYDVYSVTLHYISNRTKRNDLSKLISQSNLIFLFHQNHGINPLLMCKIRPASVFTCSCPPYDPLNIYMEVMVVVSNSKSLFRMVNQYIYTY